ncbi:hypothetical protein WA026_018987 [Henosepilachna vigintioctopunctata]|uniref:Uncharacterized protein n=1 Tax=Henosepilachna vigintioctopunctata TaxID=420089 RepID=A0AAW1V907_9CUCU
MAFKNSKFLYNIISRGAQIKLNLKTIRQYSEKKGGRDPCKPKDPCAPKDPCPAKEKCENNTCSNNPCAKKPPPPKDKCDP